MEKALNKEKEKNYKIQNKLDNIIKDLKYINDSYKTLKLNNEKLLNEYQEKIDELNKGKNELILQNKELLDKIKQKEEGDLSKKLSDIIKEDNNNEKNCEEKIEDINKCKEDPDFYKN